MKSNKKIFILCYACIGLLVIDCAISLALCKWFYLFLNVCWLVIACMILGACKYNIEIRREKREQMLLNSKLIDIIAELAAEDNKVGTVFAKVSQAREEAYKEAEEEE